MFVENLYKSIGKCFFATFCFSEQKYSFVINTFIMYMADPSPRIYSYIYYILLLYYCIACKM